jgi:hypothetical protein
MSNGLSEEHLQPRTIACDHCPLLIQVREGRVKLETTSEIWKWVATTSFGIIIGLVVFWFSNAGQAVTRSDMESFIKNYSPYAVDRTMVTQGLMELKQGVKELSDEQKRQASSLQRLETTMQAHIQK